MKKLLERILDYAVKHPLAFLGLCSWFVSPIVLGLLSGFLNFYIPDWFWGFMFFIGLVCLLLSQKYEKGA